MLFATDLKKKKNAQRFQIQLKPPLCFVLIPFSSSEATTPLHLAFIIPTKLLSILLCVYICIIYRIVLHDFRLYIQLYYIVH